jgi:dethiobiotin synthetase
MRSIIVAGIGTGVGKTITSCVLVELLQADYWKPIQCGNLDKTDSHVVKALCAPQTVIHTEAYRFVNPASPHAAAHLENTAIHPSCLVLPHTKRPLIIECAGGLLVPLTDQCLQIDQFNNWNAEWVLVSKHYLGSINHTLMSIEILKQKKVKFLGLIFNGCHDLSEKAILGIARIPCLGRLLPEKWLTREVIQEYARQWKVRT